MDVGTGSFMLIQFSIFVSPWQYTIKAEIQYGKFKDVYVLK